MDSPDLTCPLCRTLRLGPLTPVRGRLLCSECALAYQQSRGLKRLRLWLQIMSRGKQITLAECD